MRELTMNEVIFVSGGTGSTPPPPPPPKPRIPGLIGFVAGVIGERIINGVIDKIGELASSPDPDGNNKGLPGPYDHYAEPQP